MCLIGFLLCTALVLVLGGTSRAAFMTLDDPNAVSLSQISLRSGTFLAGVSGNTVVGSYTPAGYAYSGLIYSGGSYTTLVVPHSGGIVHAYGIDGDNVVGQYYIGGYGDKGFSNCLAP